MHPRVHRFRPGSTWRAGAALAAGCLALAGCTTDSASPTGASTGTAGASNAPQISVEQELANAGKVTGADFCGSKQITLGIHDGFGINAWSQESLAAVRSEAAKCPNVKQVVAIGEGDLQKSISQVNSMVAQGVNALVLIPDFGQAQLASIRAATNAGVKVVPWGADPGGADGTDYVSYVDWESSDAGTRWAEWMVKTLGGKGNVVMIGGPAGNPVTAGQLKSVVQVMQANPGIKLLTGDKDWPVTNWDPATAQKVMSSLLAKYPKIDGIISDYGTDALAATRALQAANRPLVPIATLDANGLSCLYDKEKASSPNFQLATISSRNWLGRIAARKAIAAAQGLANNEPSRFQLPIIEDSTGSPKPVCRQGLADDFYNSNQIEPADIAQYGKP
ncbi:MAG TPA: substrate-binding domain-containing protein [Mycobacteriales bacterium]|nr:substrate-binding domain-containing protein [Mycobacteriales bacterium]